ncbi:hypothetical protein ACLHDG_09025 [Sulfurovum sp. CS9]
MKSIHISNELHVKLRLRAIHDGLNIREEVEALINKGLSHG